MSSTGPTFFLAKPTEGVACNGCGYCCATEPCAVATEFLGEHPGPCKALEHDAGRTWCGMVRNPVRYLLANQNVPEGVGGKLSVEVAGTLRLGMGCDARDDDEALEWNINQRLKHFNSNIFKLIKKLITRGEFLPLKIDISRPAKSFNDSAQAFTNYGARTERELTKKVPILESNGWYVNEEMSLPVILQFFDGEKLSTERIANYFCENSTEIIEAISKRLPERKKILHEALKLHHKEIYTASIPLLLIQADGICHDLTGKSLFLTKDGIPEIGMHEIFQEKSILSSIYGHFIKKNGLNHNKTERQKHGSSGLNRHEILHGLDNNYMSRINSLKCISLVASAGFLNANAS